MESQVVYLMRSIHGNNNMAKHLMQLNAIRKIAYNQRYRLTTMIPNGMTKCLTKEIFLLPR